MTTARDVAAFLFELDKDKQLLSDVSIIERNGRKFYAGNARLNKYIHLSQNIFYAQTGQLLFEDDIYAYDNGGVVPEIQENYMYLKTKKDSYDLSDDEKIFLKKMYFILQNASIEKLIELSHEDPEWIKRHKYYDKAEQCMDIESNLEIYKKQYADIIRVMDGITV